jgi:type IV pilus assembly protein PilV
MQDKPVLNQNAFSLIEVLIALSIFSIGILAVVSLQISSMDLNTSSRRLTDATAMASERMERLLALPYTHENLLEDKNEDFQDTSGIYEISWNINEDQFINDTKTIQVIVAYNNRGEQRQVVLQQVKNRK